MGEKIPGGWARLAAVLLALGCASGWAAADTGAFGQGLAAYRAGQYEEALRHFVEAWEQGDASEQLQYNIGVTYYRLNDLPAARSSFETLARRPKLAAEAHYNLGLVALKTGEPARARTEFEQARDLATSPDLRSLAVRQLGQGPTTPAARPIAKPASRASGFVDLAGGYDDNVALAAESSLIPPAQRASGLASLLAGGRTSLVGDHRNGLELAGSVSFREYPQVSRFSLRSVKAGPRLRARFGGLQTELGVSASYITVGSNPFQTLGTVSARASHSIGAGQVFSAAYDFDHITGGKNYRSLDGSRQSLKLTDRWTLSAGSIALGYRLELNRRKDLSRPPEFFSTSPTRHRGFAELEWKLADAAKAYCNLEYERSRYHDPDIRLPTLAPETRQDRRFTGEVGLGFEIATGWTLAGEYRYLKRQSNEAVHDYLSNRYQLQLERRFP